MVDHRDLSAVRALLDRSRTALMKQYEAAGVGVGKHADGFAIVVYLATSAHRPAREIDLEGVPLKFEVTGPFNTASH